MHDGGLNPVLGKRAVMDLPARIGAEDDERAFGALLGPDGDERARVSRHVIRQRPDLPLDLSVDRIASRREAASSSPTTCREQDALPVAVGERLGRVSPIEDDRDRRRSRPGGDRLSVISVADAGGVRRR